MKRILSLVVLFSVILLTWCGNKIDVDCGDNSWNGVCEIKHQDIESWDISEVGWLNLEELAFDDSDAIKTWDDHICGESLIYDYYSLINAKDFEEAFKMRYDSNKSLEDFSNLYDEIYAISVESIEEISDWNYEMIVRIDDVDGINKYKVEKKVVDWKLKSISTQKMEIGKESPEDLITKYYHYINDWDFEKAFAMRYQSSSTLEEFKNVYKNVKNVRVMIDAYNTRDREIYEYWVELLDKKNEHNTYVVKKKIIDNKLQSVSSEKVDCYECWDKPVIYFYPTKKQEISVKLDLDWYLVASYPEYSKKLNWRKFVADVDWTLHDVRDGKEYSYIFWEAGMNLPKIKEWFVVAREDTIEFLQEKLAYLGLTPREYNEFIVYRWQRLKQNKYNLIYFAGEDYTSKAKLTIVPKPDSIQRVFMVFEWLDKITKIPEQKLKKFERTWFSVIEWWGWELK